MVCFFSFVSNVMFLVIFEESVRHLRKNDLLISPVWLQLVSGKFKFRTEIFIWILKLEGKRSGLPLITLLKAELIYRQTNKSDDCLNGSLRSGTCRKTFWSQRLLYMYLVRLTYFSNQISKDCFHSKWFQNNEHQTLLRLVVCSSRPTTWPQRYSV